MMPEDKADGRARLRVGFLIRQVIIGREALVMRGGADAAGEIDASRREMLPESSAGGQQAGIVKLTGKVNHGAVEIHSAHGMARDLPLLTHREMRLIVFVGTRPVCCRVFAAQARLLVVIVGLFPTFLHKILAETQIARLTGDAIELDQRQFDLFMARIAAFLAGFRAEDAVDMVGVAREGIQQGTFTGGLEMGYGSFDEMTGAI